MPQGNQNPTPPKGYKLVNQSPQGHVLNSSKGRDSPEGVEEKRDEDGMLPNDDVPAFIKDDVNLNFYGNQTRSNFPTNKLDPNTTAYVDTNDPFATIHVVRPEQMTPGILNHEMTHVYQVTRSRDIPPSYADTTGGGNDNYKTGGVNGLNIARSKGLHAADLNMEQQAELVREYKAAQDKYLMKARNGTITDKDKKDFSDIHAAYNPFLQEMARVPNQTQGENQNLNPGIWSFLTGTNLPTINVRPKVPGLPPYDVPGLGVLPSDSLLGGNSVAIPTRTNVLPLHQVKELAANLNPSSPHSIQTQPIRPVGERKRFANGKLGIWDGHGWAQQ